MHTSNPSLTLHPSSSLPISFAIHLHLHILYVTLPIPLHKPLHPHPSSSLPPSICTSIYRYYIIAPLYHMIGPTNHHRETNRPTHTPHY